MSAIASTFRPFSAPFNTVIGIALVLFSIFALPSLIVEADIFADDAAGLEQARASARSVGVQASLGLALTISAFIALESSKQNRRNDQLTLFSNAVDQLASSSWSTRYGAVRSLALVADQGGEAGLVAAAEDLLTHVAATDEHEEVRAAAASAKAR